LVLPGIQHPEGDESFQEEPQRDGRKEIRHHQYPWNEKRPPSEDGKTPFQEEMVNLTSVDFQVGDGSQTGDGLMEGWEVKLDWFVGQL